MFLSSAELAKQAKVEVDVEMLRSHCGKCGLNKECQNPDIKVQGQGKRKILILGDLPSYEDDSYNSVLSGEAGEYLNKIMPVNLRKDCWSVNAVRCYAPTFKLTKEAKLCSGYIEKLIYELKPKAVLILGSLGITSILPNLKNKEVARWRGHLIPDRKYKTKIFNTFHPREVLADNFNYNLKSVFERDIKKFFSSDLSTFKDVPDEEKCVVRLTSFDKVVSILKKVLKKKPPIYFDYETTGLKPYKPGHKIATIAFSVSADKAYAFPYEYNKYWTTRELQEIKSLWSKILKDPKIKNSAHNWKFEDMWSTFMFATRPEAFDWDTMMAAHILDNRRAYSGLKFQTYIHFGVRPYDEHIEKFLKSDKGEFNTVMKAPLKDLLIYNGLDCIHGWRLMEKQRKALDTKRGMRHANRFFTDALACMGTIQTNGIMMDEAYYAEQRKKLTYKIKKLTRQLQKGREARKFHRMYNRHINLTSGEDLGLLFYEVLGQEKKMTANGNYKTDKDTIGKFNLPFVDKLLDMRRLEKARGTYLAQFQREVYDGCMHPFFDLHIPVSYRSSSSRPNFQNQPKRDKEVKKIIRCGMIPRKGRVVMEADFSGAEVITSACYHKDKNFINYLVDPTTDMHRDNALDLWQLEPEALVNPDFTREQDGKAKMIRFFAKNNWTFAQFYGDWYDSCARTLWYNCIEDMKLVLPSGQTLQDHINSKDIYDVEDFVEHCKGVEDKMWYERFPQYTQWKEDIVKFYQKKGYIETFFGFRFQGYMDKKQCTNFPIQGTSFHLLVYTLMEVQKFIEKNKLRTKLIGQVHDSIISDVPVNEVEFYSKGVNKIINGLKDRFRWLIVPMEMEAEITLPSMAKGTFNDLYEIKPDVIDNFSFKAVYKDALNDVQYQKLDQYIINQNNRYGATA